LLGTKDNKEFLTKLEAVCKGMSSKPVKVVAKDNVKFDFKIKGQKPVVTKEICQFNVTGADFKEEEIVKVMEEFKFAPME